MGSFVTHHDVASAHARIMPYVLRTPLLAWAPHPGLHLFLKAENLQSTGAFKLRGAFSLMTTLRDAAGVVAHSSGNHAQAVARAARTLGRPAVVVMPADAPALKRARTEADGARVVTVGPDSDERRLRAEEIARSEGLVAVPPYDHALVAAGQGTAALEMLEDLEAPLDQFFCPVSGGGLLSGCSAVFRHQSPRTQIIGVEPVGAHDVYLSLAKGTRTRVPPPSTIADGLRVRMVGAGPWDVIRDSVARVALVTDQEMLDAMAVALRNLRVVLEPSGAAALAAALRDGGGRVGVLLSGGNVDPALLEQVAARHRRVVPGL